MSTRSSRILVTLGLGLALCGGGSPAWADAKGDKEKAEKELDKAEKGQKKDGEAVPPEQGPNPLENPLEKILELMKGVEDRLFEADTGEFTQAEQKKLVEALRFEEKTQKALDELIDKIQNSQSQSSSSSSSQQQKDEQQKKQQQQKNQQNQQQKSKQQQEKEKEQERQRQAQREKEQQKNMSKEEREKQEREKQEKQKQEQAKQDEKTGKQEHRTASSPEDQEGKLNDAAGASGRWGNLPAKLFQDANNVRNRPTPARYKRLIERYRERVSRGD